MTDFNTIFELAADESFNNQIKCLTPLNEYNSMDLSDTQLEILIKKLSSFPEKYIQIAFLYYNNLKTRDLEKIFNISNAVNYIQFINETLSYSIGLKDILISNKSMKIACNKIIVKSTSKLFRKNLNSIEYSDKFKRKINKLIPHCFSVSSYKWLKKIAVILIIVIAGSTSLFTFNATARQKLLNWLINTFPKYSEFFNITTDTKADKNDLDKYKVTYLPKGFTIYNKSGFDSSITEEYKNDSDKYIWVFKKISEKSPINLNTESSDIQWLLYKDTEYLYWKKDGVYYLIWEKDGITFSISTNIDEETSIKIAESIKK